jgi:hypothetical protein
VNSRAGRSGGGRVSIEGADLDEQVTVTVEEGAVHPGRAMADTLIPSRPRGNAVESGYDPQAAATSACLAASVGWGLFEVTGWLRRATARTAGTPSETTVLVRKGASPNWRAAPATVSSSPSGGSLLG